MAKCLRCREGVYVSGKCNFCGVASNRVVRRHRRRIIGGKRGRNSGKVSSGNRKSNKK